MRAARNILVFLVAFAFAARGLRFVTPEPRVPIVSAKLEWLARHGDDYDVLFVGSSRVYRGIMPDIFDEAMAAGGERVRSFNLAADGMFPPEDTFVLERALSARRAPLRFVFADCISIKPRVQEDELDTVRGIYWHDWERTSSVIHRSLLGDDEERGPSARLSALVDAWPSLSEHAAAWAHRSTALGLGNDELAAWMLDRPDAPPDLESLGTRLDGFVEEDPRLHMSGRELENYQRDLADMRAAPLRVETDPISLADVEEKRRLAARLGAVLVLVIPPRTTTSIFRPEGSIVLDFCDPDEFPDLYAVEHHSSRGHLNREGAELYTRHIAEKLLDVLKRGEK